MSKRQPSIKIPPPRSGSDVSRQPVVSVEHLKGLAKAAIKNLLHLDLPTQRAQLHKSAVVDCDNLGTFFGRTTPTIEEVAAIIDDAMLLSAWRRFSASR
jgi:hypothetical protein